MSLAEANVEGRPHLVVDDEDLEAVAEILADALVASIEREALATARCERGQ